MTRLEQDFASPIRLKLAKQARPDTAKLVIVVPVFNEAESITPFLTALEPICADLNQQKCDVYFTFVNDGSHDDTLGQLVDQASSRANVSILDFSRNFGKEAALTAGISDSVARDFDIIIPMDIDLQDPPELILEMVDKWRQGYQLVLARRVDRSSDSWFKAWSAKQFYRLFNAASKQKIPENVGDFRLMDRQVAIGIGHLNEKGRMMKALMGWVGFTRTYVDYTRPARQKGRSAFNAFSLARLAINGILSFSTLPLRAILILGLAAGLFAFAYSAFIMTRTVVFGVDVPGYASTLVIILVAAALQLTTLGIVGEYIARLFEEVKSRPHYIVSHRIDGKSAHTLVNKDEA